PVAGRETLSHWFWRELTSSDVGAIITQLHYRILVNKFMANNSLLGTGVLLDQFYKNPDLPVPSEEGVVARAIQLGVKDRAFGLAELRGEEPDAITVKFGVDVPLDAISFGPGAVLLSRRRTEELLLSIEPEQPPGGIEPPGPTPDIDYPPPGVDAPPEPGVPSIAPADELVHHLKLVVNNIPAGRIADVNRGIFMPIKAAVGDFHFKLEIEVNVPDGISNSIIENTIKETIRQIGAKLEEESLD
ncbi:MAG: hypothetical protein JXA42_24705, partial [Anaerolineales bacterium]|nr:hypothetical protein [Anaerolineales bacterium]